MLDATIQRLESRLDEFVDVYRRLKSENVALKVELDGLHRERHFMREELDRILARFAKIEEDSL